MEQCKYTWPYCLMSIKNAMVGRFYISETDTQKCIAHLQLRSHKCWLPSSQSLGASTLENLHNAYKASLYTTSICVYSCLKVILFGLSFNPTVALNTTITNLIETQRQQIWFSQLTENMKCKSDFAQILHLPSWQSSPAAITVRRVRRKELCWTPYRTGVWVMEGKNTPKIHKLHASPE